MVHLIVHANVVVDMSYCATRRSGVDAMKAVKKLREEGYISSDVILMVDEMYLQKGTKKKMQKF